MAAAAGSNQFGDLQNTVGNLNGFFKDLYADKLHTVIPEGFYLLKNLNFSEKERLGNMFNCPVITGLENGLTYASSIEDAFALNGASAGKTQNAQVKGAPIVIQGTLGYLAAARAANGKSAFMDATKYLVASLMKSLSKAIELTILYGQSGLATIGSVSGAVITVSAASWATGIWIGCEGMKLDIYSSAGVLRNGASTPVTIVSVDLDAHTITTDTTLSSISAVATDIVFPYHAKTKQAQGIVSILSQTSGSLFGIDQTANSIFKGSSYDAGGAALSFNKIVSAAAVVAAKGKEGKLTVLLSPKTWANINSDQAALRKYDASYSESEAKNGVKAIKFYSQTGEIELIPYIYMKEGMALMLSLEDFSRVGSTDITFNRPGMGNQQFFRDLDQSAGYELRALSDQAVFTTSPAHSLIISNIVNS